MKKNYQQIKQASLVRRQKRVRAKIFGTAEKPRLSVSRSLKNVFLQLIDDNNGRTLVSLHSKTIASKDNKTTVAFSTGENLAKKALAQGIKTCVFDRGGRQYHGRIKAVADGARQGGLQF
ncbi:MAG TPA: 50S ribosomal protein L18 [Candidatus Paceibacterota bacterium]|nr:50S ribosomal protein L18 [Candidatus Paceibacterota bacterium]